MYFASLRGQTTKKYGNKSGIKKILHKNFGEKLSGVGAKIPAEGLLRILSMLTNQGLWYSIRTESYVYPVLCRTLLETSIYL